MDWGVLLVLLCMTSCGLVNATCWNLSLQEDYLSLNKNAVRRFGHLNAELILTGPIYQLEDFSDCFDELNQQYCTVDVLISAGDKFSPLWNQIEELTKIITHFRRDLLRVGLCVLKRCSSEEVSRDLQEFLTPAAHRLGVTVNVSIEPDMCQVKQELNITNIKITEYLSGLVMLCILMVLIAGTSYDALRRVKGEEKPPQASGGKFLMGCSLLSNMEKLGNLSDTDESVALRPIQGIRTISIYLVLGGHVLFAIMNSPIENPEFIEESYKDFFRISLSNGQATMGTFLCMSGFLLSYFFLKEAHKRGSIRFVDIIKAILLRYLRLTPVYAIVVMLQSTWFSRLGQGPMRHYGLGRESENCKDHGWINLLYLNNYFYTRDTCLTHTWYLAADFQCYIFSLLLLAVVFKFPSYARSIFGTTVVFWTMVNFVQTYVEELGPVYLSVPSVVQDLTADDTFRRMYITFHGNASAHVIGVICGYAFYHIRQTPFKRTKRMFAIIWAIILSVPWIILVLPYIFYQPSYKYDVLSAAIFASLSKVIFAGGIGILILAYCLGYGWIGYVITAWKPFQVIGRLTYTIYLIHATIELADGTRAPKYISQLGVLEEWFGLMVTSTLIGFLLTISVEMPFANIIKLTLRGAPKQEEALPSTYTVTKMDNDADEEDKV